MQRSGGDGLNHQDWTRAIGDVGVAYCASGKVAAALHLIERLSLHDADERAAASAVRRAAASAFADAGDLAAAEQQIALIPDAPARRAASAVVVRYYARSGDYKSALRHIRSSRMSGNIEQCVEVVNLLVEQKFIGTIEDYNAIVAAMESNPASSRERA